MATEMEFSTVLPPAAAAPAMGAFSAADEGRSSGAWVAPEAVASSSSSKRHGEGSEDVAGGEAKRLRDDDDDDEPNPYDYREMFNFFWDYYQVQFDETTRGSMSRTSGSRMYACLEIYSFEVTELKAGLEWPIDVYGLVAVHDGLDRKRNYIFNRRRDDAQTLTAENSYLLLTGPIRAIDCRQRVEFEIELKVRGKRQSEDKVLNNQYIVYETIGPGTRIGQVRSKTRSVKRCSIEVKFGHMAKAVEATIEVKIVEGSSNFRGRFVARTHGFDEDVVLLDSGDASVPVIADGVIKLTRRVVVVEGAGVLNLYVCGWKGQSKNDVAKYDADKDSNNGTNAADVACEDRAMFTAQRFESSSETLDIGFCKMVATIYWSLIPLL